MRYVNDMGIPVVVTDESSGMSDAQKLLKGYALFEQMLEQALPLLRGVQVFLWENRMKCVFEGVELTPPGESPVKLTVENNCTFAQIPLREEFDAL